MNLSTFIRHLGVKRFAKEYRVTERAAQSWQYGARHPKPDVARRIVEQSGIVTWPGIYGFEAENRPKKAA